MNVMIGLLFLLISDVLAGDGDPPPRGLSELFGPPKPSSNCLRSALVKIQNEVAYVDTCDGPACVDSYKIKTPRGIIRLHDDSRYVELLGSDGASPVYAEVKAVNQGHHVQVVQIFDPNEPYSHLTGFPQWLEPEGLTRARPSVEAKKASELNSKQKLIRFHFLSESADGHTVKEHEIGPDTQSNVVQLPQKLTKYVFSDRLAWSPHLGPTVDARFTSFHDFLWIIDAKGRIVIAPTSLSGLTLKRLAQGQKVLAAGKLHMDYVAEPGDPERVHPLNIRLNFDSIDWADDAVKAAAKSAFEVMVQDPEVMMPTHLYSYALKRYKTSIPFPTVSID